LSRFIAPGGVGAELGVHKGYFSPVLLEGLAPEKLYLIDPWYLQGKEWTWGEGNRRAVDALCRILRELEDELAIGKAVLWIDDDLVALTRMPDEHLDWANLDTTHQYDETARELQLLKQKIKPGGRWLAPRSFTPAPWSVQSGASVCELRALHARSRGRDFYAVDLAPRLTLPRKPVPSRCAFAPGRTHNKSRQHGVHAATT